MKQTQTQEKENNQPCPQQIGEVAKEILKVIKVDIRLPMSWGFSNAASVIYNEMPSLRFTVNGFLHKGQVVVALNEGMDLYEIFILNNKGTVLAHVNEVYFDELTNILDSLIETKSPSSVTYYQKITAWLEDIS